MGRMLIPPSRPLLTSESRMNSARHLDGAAESQFSSCSWIWGFVGAGANVAAGAADRSCGETLPCRGEPGFALRERFFQLKVPGQG